MEILLTRSLKTLIYNFHRFCLLATLSLTKIREEKTQLDFIYSWNYFDDSTKQNARVM